MEQHPNTGYLCFMIAAKFLRMQVPQEFAGRFTEDENTDYELMKAAKELGLKASAGKLNLKKVEDAAVPVIAKLKNGEYLLIVNRRDEHKWTILNPLKGAPETMEESALLEILSGQVIVLARRKTDPAGEDCRKFGFRWFIPTILKFKKQFLCVLLAVFVIQILGILTPLMTQVVVDKVLSHHAMNTLYTIAVGIFIVYVYELVISLCKGYLFVHTTNRIDVTLSARLFHHLFGLPLKYFESRRVGETVARVRELDQIRSFLTGTPLSSMIDVFFVVVYVAVLFLYSVPLTIIVLASLPLFAILSLIITPLFKKSLDEKFETGAKAQSFLVESVNGIHTVKSFALESSFEEKWGDLQSDYVKAGYKTSMIAQTSNAVAGFIQHLADLLVLVYGAGTVIDGTLSIGQLVAFRMLAGRVSGPILRLVQLWQEYQQASLSVKRIGDIFNSPIERKSDNSMQTIALMEYVLTSDFNTAWDKNLWEDIYAYGYVRDVADWFVSDRPEHKLGTVYALLDSLYLTDISLYARLLLQCFGEYRFDRYMILYYSAALVRRYCPALFAEENPDIAHFDIEIYERLLTCLFSGRACCHLEKEEQYAWVRGYFDGVKKEHVERLRRKMEVRGEGGENYGR